MIGTRARSTRVRAEGRAAAGEREGRAAAGEREGRLERLRGAPVQGARCAAASSGSRRATRNKTPCSSRKRDGRVKSKFQRVTYPLASK